MDDPDRHFRHRAPDVDITLDHIDARPDIGHFVQTRLARSVGVKPQSTDQFPDNPSAQARPAIATAHPVVTNQTLAFRSACEIWQNNLPHLDGRCLIAGQDRRIKADEMTPERPIPSALRKPENIATEIMPRLKQRRRASNDGISRRRYSAVPLQAVRPTPTGLAETIV